MANKNPDTSNLPQSGTPRPTPRRRSQPAHTLSEAGDRELRGGPSHSEIAEAAYLRYLSRGGADGRDLDDWIEAERELRAERNHQT